MDYKIHKTNKYTDERGDLVVFLKRNDLPGIENEFGQIYFVTFTDKGVVRGNHYHKKWREWFGVVQGKLQVALKDIKTGEMIELVLDGNKHLYTRLEIGPNIVHAFKSITKNASLLNYANSPWSSEDTFKEIILT